MLRKTKAPPDAEGQLPPGWSAHQSRSNPSLFYYFNSCTGATTWNRLEVIPTATVETVENVSGGIPIKKAAEVVRRENVEKSVNNNNTSNKEGDEMIVHLEKLLHNKESEVQVLQALNKQAREEKEVLQGEIAAQEEQNKNLCKEKEVLQTKVAALQEKVDLAEVLNAEASLSTASSGEVFRVASGVWKIIDNHYFSPS